MGRGEGEEEGGLEVPRKLSGMRDVSNFVLKISDMGLGKQLLNGQSRCAGSPIKQWRRPFGCQGGSPLRSCRIPSLFVFLPVVASGVGRRRLLSLLEVLKRRPQDGTPERWTAMDAAEAAILRPVPIRVAKHGTI